MQVYNTLNRRKENFAPLNPAEVNMYVCGVTVYDYCHLGHARAYIVFDMIRRYLLHQGYQVNYIQNFTDIDDKIIRKASESGQSQQEITEKFIREYFTDFDRLGILRATDYPKATEHIPDIIELIGTLVRKGHAYAVNGDVYYDVASFAQYGKLSGRRLDDNEAGARVAVDDAKKNPLDFALWKAAKPGEPSWPSPWGDGRPGWHIECSVMSMKKLGKSFDIHGGGQDLIFPHHENEIAQSEAATGQPYVKYWLHNGFVNINNEKMSKSLGNFSTIRDILQKYDPEILRFYVLSTHYRSPINFSEEQLVEAQKGLAKLYQAVWENTRQTAPQSPAATTAQSAPQAAQPIATAADPASCAEKSALASLAKGSRELVSEYVSFEKEFTDYMDDDFNSAGALGVLFNLATVANRDRSPQAAILLKKLGGILGLLQAEKKSAEIPAEITVLAEQRLAAKKNKDFASADKLRAEITAQGYAIKDTAQGFIINKI
ncbi:cysteinyl-tRNA synthetase [Candidatus Termititenax persephonae]|uniref:Cysteine--tRNA ligase n=1 Tax=Candidatus Termititenax persephonae TaxID=2218525 RepID=A0A388TH17_9BACT|nr:cysteinyl-tRNA synthetase [Candidatus Termititenax persephonae]